MSIFVVNEHHAKNLHFDFRLEINNVLKSWAIPKGPSMNPAEKRLAILVDDHPLLYADYEGIIPEGYYGAGPVIIWDKGTFEVTEGSFEKRRLSIRLWGNILKGEFSLFALKSSRKEWLLIKKRDQYADSNFKLPIFLDSRELSVKKPPCDPR